MRLPEFAMERMQSTHEKSVRYDLSESGVEPLTLEEAAGSLAELARCRSRTRTGAAARGRGRSSRRSIRAPRRSASC